MFRTLLAGAFGRRAQPVVPSQLETARAHAAAGETEAAMHGYRAVLAREPDQPEALMFLADAAYMREEFAEALRHTEHLSRLDPARADFIARCARCEHKLGHAARARELGLCALHMREDLTEVHLMLSEMDMPGSPYREVLRRIHDTLRPRSYVEIGVFQGYTMALAAPGTRALGVDPAPQLQVALPPGAQIYAQTSDDFFAQHDVRAELGGLPVDLAFIDGMHRFEFALRDFMNLEACCTTESVILVHDCYPLNRATATRDQLTTFWSGDIWRLIVLLKRHRPDLHVRTIAASPTGLGIITGLDPNSTYIADHLQDMIEEGLALDFGTLEADKPAQLNRCGNQWLEITPLLPAPFRAAVPA